jgi:hypothetical protein
MADEAPFRVSWSAAAREALRRAVLADERRGLAGAVRAVNARLSSDPTGLGDIYRSRGPVEEYFAVLGFLALNFAVDTNRKFVLVRSCRVLS